MLEVSESTSISPAVATNHIALSTIEGRRFLLKKMPMRRASLLINQLLESFDGGDGSGDAGTSGAAEVLELPLPAVDASTLEAVYAWVLHHYDRDGNTARSSGAKGSTSFSPLSSSSSSFAPPTFKEIEKPLRSDLSTLVDPWDWNFVSQRLGAGEGGGAGAITAAATAAVNVSSPASSPLSPLFAALDASNFLNIPPLRELISAAIANALRGKSEEQILQLFGVASFTKYDEEAICRDYPWLQEPEM